MEMNHILIVEDDKDIREGVGIYLKSQGYQVFMAADGVEGLEVLEKEEIHLAIVDIMMPRMDGITMTMKLREKHDFPVIMLSAKSEEVDKVMGLNIGADDYVTKPFSIKVLLARIKANIRRYSGEIVETVKPSENEEDKIVIRELVIDNKNYRVTKKGKEIELSNKEYELLYFLASHAGEVFEREELLVKVWGYEGYYGGMRTVDVTMSRLRAKIEDIPAEPEYILTKRSKGYYIPA